jgi:hypothetical protein
MFLLGCLALMALSVAHTSFNSARYIAFKAYEPRIIEVPVFMKDVSFETGVSPETKAAPGGATSTDDVASTTPARRSSDPI